MSARLVGLAAIATCLAACDRGTRSNQPFPMSNTCTQDLLFPSLDKPLDGMVWIPAGSASMGANPQYVEERTSSTATTDGFWMSPYEVTIAQYAAFVSATGYITLAERAIDPTAYPAIDPDLLVPGGAVFTQPETVDTQRMNWWSFVPAAHWRQPRGPDAASTISGDLPVTQISIEDARAYADWLGHELPSEEEWEYAAIGGVQGQKYPWGDQPTVDGKAQANHWQGLFPTLNTVEDGFEGAAPVGCFSANGYGLYDIVGNVWEIVETNYSPVRDRQSVRGPVTIKGGSFLCAENFCGRFRPSARQPQERDLTTNHVGFRTIVRNAPPQLMSGQIVGD
ncbi:MAG: formylglycine-generating enzyme family protein [Pseudomonadota bacterium]